MVRSEFEDFLESAENVASFFKPRLSKNIQVRIRTHTDTDGICAGGILAKALRYYDVPFHVSFESQPTRKDLEKMRDQEYDLFAFLDMGNGQLPLIEEFLLEEGKEVIILDHHPGEFKNIPGLTCLNPHMLDLNGAKEVSAAGVVYSVVEKLNSAFRPLSAIAIIGALGDRQDSPSGLKGINERILDQALDGGFVEVQKGLLLDGRDLPLEECIRRSIRPFLEGLSGDEDSSDKFVEDLDLDPGASLKEMNPDKEEEIFERIIEGVETEQGGNLIRSLWGDVYYLESDDIPGPKTAHEYVTVLDACEKMDKIEIGFSTLMGDEDSLEDAEEAVEKYQGRMRNAIKWLISGEGKVKTADNFRHIRVDEEIRPRMMGELLSVAIESDLIKSDLPLFGLAKSDGDFLKVSARASPEYGSSGAHLGEVLKEVSGDLGGSGGGHDVAAAARIPLEKEREFLTKLDRLLADVS